MISFWCVSHSIGAKKGILYTGWFIIQDPYQWFNKIVIPIWMFPKIVVPPKHPFYLGLPLFSPSILGYPYFWKHPYNWVVFHPLYTATRFQWSITAPAPATFCAASTSMGPMAMCTCKPPNLLHPNVPKSHLHHQKSQDFHCNISSYQSWLMNSH